MKRTILLDGDMLAWVFASNNQQEIDWGDGQSSTITTSEAEVKAQVEAYLDSLCTKLRADDCVVTLSDPSRHYFRNTIYPQYKARRVHLSTPSLLSPVKKYLMAHPSAKWKPGLEADDVMGILATKPNRDYEPVVVSQDKDMQQIPGLLFNPRKDKEVREISLEQADYYHMLQTLTGDPCDGFPGCPRIGAKKAQRILDDAEGDCLEAIKGPGSEWNYYLHAFRWSAVVRTYQAKGLTEQDALTQAQVARICRWTDYDFVNKKPIPWRPHEPSATAA